MIFLICLSVHVSIHAPAWGATNHANIGFLYRMFQSTHPRGVRRMPMLIIRQKWMFQSTHPRGVRPYRASSRHPFYHCFNPRTRVGCDRRQRFTQRGAAFQSTHPRGVRPLKIRRFMLPFSFNPRTRVGCDSISLIFKRRLQSFNPRTRVGCDAMEKRGYIQRYVSIHAPAWGATAYS